MGKLDAFVISVNDFLNTAMIYTHGCHYGCPTKNVNGDWFFKFKNAWHPVKCYANENTRIISDNGNGLVNRKFM